MANDYRLRIGESPGVKKNWLFIMILPVLGLVIAGISIFAIKLIEKNQQISRITDFNKNLSEESSSVGKNPQANWHQYTNPDINFSMKYPENWSSPQIKDCQNGVELIFNKNFTISTCKKILPDGSWQDYSIGGIKGKKITYLLNGNIQQTIIVLSDPNSPNKKIIIYYNNSSDNNLEEIEGIISTINFSEENTPVPTKTPSLLPKPTPIPTKKPVSPSLAPTPTPTPKITPVISIEVKEDCIYGCVSERKFR